MSFLFLSFFFFLFLRSKQTQRGSTKPSMTYYYRSSDCVESPRVLLSTHFSSNSRSSQLIRLFWTMRCGMQRTIVFFFSFLSPYSLSLSLIYTRIHILSHSLTLRPLFRAFKMKPQGDVIARANTYVERELFTVRMQGKRLGVSQRRSLRYHEESTRKATATSNEKIKDSVDKKRMLVREGVESRDAHTMVESEAGRNREKDGGIKNG